jgi:pyrroline-5-carboxylate reductase
MKTNSLGFIGGGRITRIFLQAFTNKEVEFQSVVVFDTNPEVLTALEDQFPFIETGDLQKAARQSTLFIALHPPVIMDTLEKIADVVADDTLIISLAPKITIEKFSSKLKTRNIVRMIPNATSYINEGFNPLVYHEEMTKSMRNEVKELLNILGKTFKTDEVKLESYAIVSAMLPTYFWFQWKALNEVALQIGLSKKEAKKAIKSTLKKSIKLYYNSALSPDEVMNLIPVKPIGENEAEITEIYQKKLPALYGKIKP